MLCPKAVNILAKDVVQEKLSWDPKTPQFFPKNFSWIVTCNLEKYQPNRSRKDTVCSPPKSTFVVDSPMSKLHVDAVLFRTDTILFSFFLSAATVNTSSLYCM